MPLRGGVIANLQNAHLRKNNTVAGTQIKKAILKQIKQTFHLCFTLLYNTSATCSCLFICLLGNLDNVCLAVFRTTTSHKDVSVSSINLHLSLYLQLRINTTHSFVL